MKGKYKSYLEPRGDVTNQWNNYTKQPEDRMYMVIYGSVGGKSVVEEHLFIKAVASISSSR